MNKPNFEEMTRQELAHFMVAYRNTPEATEAQRVYIRRMAENAKRHGIDLANPKKPANWQDLS